MEIEKWKDVTGYEGLYQVSDQGRVKGLKRGKILKPQMSSVGYHHVNLCKNNNCKVQKIHKLVAIAFLNHKPSGYALVIDHINKIKTDNRAINLHIVTPRENSQKISDDLTGAYWNKISSHWTSSIYIDGKGVYLGFFKSKIEAHNMYVKASIYINLFNGNAKEFRVLLSSL